MTITVTPELLKFLKNRVQEANYVYTLAVKVHKLQRKGMHEIEAPTRLVTITEGVATLEDGTTIDLAPMQDYLAGCFTTTGYQPYADMADQLARLTGIEWREQ